MKAFRYVALTSLFVAFAGSGLAQLPTITTYAGLPLPVDGAQATTEAIGGPRSVISDGAGGFYFSSETQNRIYRVTSDGTLKLIAGTGAQGFSGDGGPATAAKVSLPGGLALDASGNLFIADNGNSRIRKVTSAGVISTVAGNGTPTFSGDGGPATSASLFYPTGVAVDM